MPKNPAQQLHDFGQSVWYDNISRDLLAGGGLAHMIAEWGVRGLTSNPTIFEKAIGSSNVYDSSIDALRSSNPTPDKVFEEIAIQDIAQAADLLLPVYEESEGVDGFVSIEVSPLLARETQGTVEEARRLHARLDRPNIMIKVPGTEEGLPAVRTLLEEGINVNITLLFSVENYVQVAETYVSALQVRKEQGLSVDKIRSVASFFVSRVDSAIDAKLEALRSKDSSTAKVVDEVFGKFGIANSKIAYKRFQEIFESSRFASLRSAGAKSQRPLWASTSTKNPTYRDVLYIEELIGKETVNTIPHATLEAFVDHGEVSETITRNVEEAEACEQKLALLGIDVPEILTQLQIEGVKKFSDSFVSLNQTISQKLSGGAS